MGIYRVVYIDAYTMEYVERNIDSAVTKVIDTLPNACCRSVRWEFLAALSSIRSSDNDLPVTDVRDLACIDLVQ